MRSTENKLIDIPLTVGMNQATSSRLSPTGTLYSVKNCRISGNGVLEKRPGSVALSGTTANPGGHSTNSHSLQGDNVTFNVESPMFACQVQGALMVGNTFGDAFAYSTVWQFQGRFSTCLPMRKRYGLMIDDTFTQTGFGNYPPDMATLSTGHIAVAALTATLALHFYIEDAAGIRIYYKEDDGAAYARVRLVAQGLTFLLITQVNGSTTINVSAVTVANGSATISAPVAIATLVAADYNWDASASDATVWYLIYQQFAGFAKIIALNLTAAGSTGTFAVTGKVPLSIWADSVGARLWCGFYDDPGVAGNVGYIVYSIPNAATITLLKAKQTIATAVNVYGPPLFGRYRGNRADVYTPFGGAFYVFTYNGLAGVTGMYTGVEFALSAGVGTGSQAIFHVQPISKPDNFNRVWCQVQSSSGNILLTKAVLLRFPDPAASPPTIELSSPNMPAIQSARPIASNMYFTGNGGLTATRSFAVIPVQLQQFNGGLTIVSFQLYEYTTGEQETHRKALVTGISTAIAGQPVELWGQSVAVINTPTTGGDFGAFAAGASEIGFAHSPIIISAVESHAGGSPLVAGVRSYKCVYEWVDLYGRRHQSAPSAPISVTVSGVNSTTTLSVTSLSISQRMARNTMQFPMLRVYRTVAGGTAYHELETTMSAADAGAGGGVLTYVDSETDATASADGFIYTDGGVLANDLAPSCRFIARTEERVWFGGLWDSTIIQCSKIIVPGEPIQCTDDASHQVQLPAPCTGLSYMDGNVIAFTADAIYLVSGDGPNDQGAGLFAAPRALTRSIGCCDYRSIVETNVGVMFQGNLGFYIVPRGFGPVQYIGAAVQDEMAEVADVAQVVFGAISHQTRNNHIARFLIGSSSGGSATTVLTYDIDSNQWFKDTFAVPFLEMAAFDSLATIGYKGAVFVRYDLATTTTTFPVWIESPSVDTDGAGDLGASIVQYIETAWIHPFGLGGYGKVNCVLLVFETFGAPFTMTLTVQTDDNTPQVGTWTVTATGIQYRAVYLVAPHAGTSFQVQIQGDPGNVGGNGFKLISLTLETEPTNGIRLLADAEKN